jgi:protocatechuate 3,4-dioxygenase, beta subunit
MKITSHFFGTALYLFLLTDCSGQTKKKAAETRASSSGVNSLVGGGCDGCELMHEGMPASIDAVDTSAGWFEPGQQLLVTGFVYQKDGIAAAPDVIIYYWQADYRGYYSPAPNIPAKAKRHGHIRGWVKTSTDGHYAIYTSRPAPYPGEKIPAHIHLSIKEPGIANEYYIDDWVFDDDTLLTKEIRTKTENRGGSGIMTVLASDRQQIAEHNIVLGLHIPGYPENKIPAIASGLEISEGSPSFIPFHAWGPDKGSRACPVCKYGRHQGVLYFVGSRPDWPDIKKWLLFLESETVKRGHLLKVYLVYGNEKKYSPANRYKELEKIGEELGLKNCALTFVPSLNDRESEVFLNKINPETENTLILYRQRIITAKFINLKATATSFDSITAALNKGGSPYSHLNEKQHDP